MTLLDTAMEWVENGFSVIPVLYRDKRPDARLLPRDEYGKPEWESYQKRLPTNTELRFWFPSRLHNIALITGWNNLVVIDFDNMSVFDTWYHLYPVQTYMIKTNRGMHVYFTTAQPTPNYHGAFLDVKSQGGYVLIPPSIHPSGYQYQVYNNAPIMPLSILSTVLPLELMPVKDVQPIAVPRPIVIQDDPWESAQNAFDDDVIEHIRQKSLLDYFPQAIKKSGDGRWWVACCPFHDDHNPSFWIDTKRGICGCYSGCTSKPMDVINLVSRLYNLDNIAAINYLVKGL